MFWKKKTRLERAQEAGTHAVEQIQDILQNLPLEQWQDKVHELRENASHLAERARSNVAEHAGDAGSRARHAAEMAQEAADLTSKKEALQGVLSSAQKVVESRMQKGREHIAENIDEADDEIIVEYLPDQGSGSKWLWIAVGMMVGAVIALLIAPASGRRSRALLRDKLSQGKHRAEEMGRAAGETVSSAADRVAGAAHESQKAVSSEAEEADDETVADRVRTELGQNAATQDLERINVSCSEGNVTLHGPHLSAQEQQKVAEVVRAVPGVREIENKLEQGDSKNGDSEDGDSKKDKAKSK